MQRCEITCVVVAFHRPVMLRRLVATLQDPRIEVIVVNVEDDEAIRDLEGTCVIPVASNVGYAAAVNTGVARASTESIVFMNDDIDMGVDDVCALVARMTSGRADVVVPLVLDDSGELELPKRRQFRLASRVQLKGDPVPTEPTPVDSAWAVAVAVKRDMIRAVPLPEDYFMYWEDDDWFYQLRQRRAAIELLPTTRVIHHGGVRHEDPRKNRLMARNAVRCVRRVRGRGAALRTWPCVVAIQAGMLTVSVLRRDGRERIRARIAGTGAALMAWREI